MNPKFLFSYSWQDKDIVNGIEKDWMLKPVKIHHAVSSIRNPDNTKANRNITIQMNESDFIVVIVSDYFLKSANCVIELSYILKDPKLSKKLIPVATHTTNQTKNIDENYYKAYWAKKVTDEYQKQIPEERSLLNTIKYFESHRDNLEKYDRASLSIANIIKEINYLNVLNWPNITDNNYEDLLNYSRYNENDIFLESRKLLGIKDHEEREIALDNLLKKYPNSKNLLRLEAKFAIDENKFKKASILLNSVILKNPNYAEAYYDLANIYQYRIDDFTKARELYEKAITLDKSAPNFYYQLGLLHHYKFLNYKKAIINYKNALALDSYNRNYHYNIANIFNEELADYEKAKDHYQKAIDIQPDDIDSMFKLASILSDIFFDYKNARLYYERILNIDPNNVNTLFNLSLLLTKIYQEYNNAQKYYNQLLTITPDNAEAQTRLKMLIKKMQERTMTPAAYFTEINLENVRSFGINCTINLSKNGIPTQWNIILGNNGVGKTTILKSLAVMMPVEAPYLNDEKSESSLTHRYIPVYASKWRPRWSPLRHQGKNNAKINFTASKGFRLSDIKEGISINQSFNKVASINAGGLSYDGYNEDEIGLVCYGYGAGRSIGTSALSDEQEPLDTCISLFDDKANLMNPEEWFLQLDYRAKSDDTNKNIWFQQLEVVKDILTKVLPGITEVRVSPVGQPGQPKQGLELNGPYGWVRLSEMSLGYQILAVWLTDFASRLFVRYPYSENPLAEPAIALVDEIDLHLHPEWQRRLIKYLTEIFPNTQFIVTAHSPLVVQAASDAGANIILLELAGKETIVRHDLPSIQGWRLDQIVASDLFGQKTAHSLITESWMQKRIDLSSNEKLTDEEKKELDILNQKAQSQPVGSTAEEREEEEILRELARRLGKSELMK